jgi:FkbH-like protein
MLSDEDRERGRLYAEQRERARSEQAFGSLEDFLMSLSTKVRVAPVTEKTIARTAQLTQKTNQFNTTTRRYAEQDIARLAIDERWRVLTVDAADRFGDHGIIGSAIVQRAAGRWDIDTLLLSCRVIGRGIEMAVLAALAELAWADGATNLTGAVVPTAKNAPARDVYSAHGFSLVREEGGTTRWSLDLAAATVSVPPWIACEVVEGVAAS